MFTYIKLQNFMSFKEVAFDFRDGKRSVKKFISIYGENGSGKSNFVNSIDFLRRSIDSLDKTADAKNLPKLLQKRGREFVLNELFANTEDILWHMRNCRMLECDEETVIEAGFEIDGHSGYYVLAFQEQFVYEKLYYFTGKQNGQVFEVKYEDGRKEISLSSKLISAKGMRKVVRDKVRRLWGKHTFLSILNREQKDHDEEYIRDNYLPYAFDFIHMLRNMTLDYKAAFHLGVNIGAGDADNVLRSLKESVLEPRYEYVLDQCESILRDFFTQTFADIKDVYYKREVEDGSLHYILYFKKMIGGKLRDVSSRKESTGTKRILEIFHALLGVFRGGIVVLDEIDNGVHDLLLKAVLDSMQEFMTGQLIITTHNTFMLEAPDVKSVYMINVDRQGNKEVRCLNQYSRIQGSNNPRLMYLKGAFGAVPAVDVVDYHRIVTGLEEQEMLPARPIKPAEET